MFLNALQKQNPKLIEAAVSFFEQGRILPDSYVIDVDQFLQNARLIVEKANQLDITLYAMTKQIGRNPYLCKKLIELGFAGIVAVDFKEARQLYRHGIKVAHIGHLVQPPKLMLDEILTNKPEVITVYSLEKVQQINEIAKAHNRVQDILLKVYQPDDALYPGQEAGFALAGLNTVIDAIKSLKNVRIVGATHFPCMLYDAKQQKTVETPNLATLLNGVKILKEQGMDVKQINAPSATSCETLPLLAQFGVTHGEPGHALTGTSPANQFGEQPEKIAMLYLSEISHHFNGQSYCFGGGYYRRGHLSQALVIEKQNQHHAEVLPVDDSSIDYCLRLAGTYPISSAVVMCFRTQVFVTRSDVVLIGGIFQDKPELIGIYDSLGNEVTWRGKHE